MAGCTTNETSGLRGFHAVLVDDVGAEYIIDFSGPVPVVGRDGISRLAYVLEVTSDRSHLMSGRHYLAKDLLVVRRDWACDTWGKSCDDYLTRSWIHQGDVPPHGFALNRLSKGGHVSWWEPRVETPLAVERRHDGDRTIVRIEEPPSYVDVTSKGTFTYTGQRLLGLKAGWMFKEYDEGKLLPLADDWPHGQEAVLRPRTDFMFLGERDDAFNMGRTPRDFLDALASQRPWVDQSLTSGCFHELELSLEPRETMTLTEARRAFEANLRLQMGRDIHSYDVTLEQTTNRITGETSWSATILDGEFRQAQQTSCEERANGPAPTISPQEFLASARNVGLHIDQAYRFSASSGDVPARSPRPVTTGWDEYNLVVEPEGGAPFTLIDGYGFVMEANTGWMEFLTSDPILLT